MKVAIAYKFKNLVILCVLYFGVIETQGVQVKSNRQTKLGKKSDL